MSKARTCDGCGKTIVLDDRGDDPDGEIAAWVRQQVGAMTFDACTRQCAHDILDRPDVVSMHDEFTDQIMQIARSLRGDDPEGDGDGSD